MALNKDPFQTYSSASIKLRSLIGLGGSFALPLIFTVLHDRNNSVCGFHQYGRIAPSLHQRHDVVGRCKPPLLIPGSPSSRRRCCTTYFRSFL